MEPPEVGSLSQATARALSQSASQGATCETDEVHNDEVNPSQSFSILKRRSRCSKFDSIFGKSFEKDCGAGKLRTFRVCLLCQEKKIKVEVSCPKHNTSNMAQHLRIHHRDVPGICETLIGKTCQGTSQNIMTMFQSGGNEFAAAGSSFWDQLLHHLKLLTCKCNISINTLTSETFLNFATFLNSRVATKYPNRNMIKTGIDDLYKAYMARNDTEIQNSTFKITLLIDGWTSRRVKGYFAVMASFVTVQDNKHIPKTRLLRLIACDKHKADDLYSIMKEYVWINCLLLIIFFYIKSFQELNFLFSRNLGTSLAQTAQESASIMCWQSFVTTPVPTQN